MALDQAAASLAEAASMVIDVESFRAWVEGPLRAVLPHRGLFCGQSVFHAGGYTAVRRWSFGLPVAYEASITCAGGNVRSPVLQRLLAEGGPICFDAGDSRAPIDPGWRRRFLEAGWHSLVGFARRSPVAPDFLLTTAGFYDVPSFSIREFKALQKLVMPMLEQICSGLPSVMVRTSPLANELLTGSEAAVVALLSLGKSNKEIAHVLGKSQETVKKQVQSAMRRLGARNRMELARMAAERPS